MRKKIPHKNLREKSLSMSCENRNCILLCHKKGVRRSKSCCANFQQKTKQEVFLLLRVFIIMIISLSKLLRVKD
jgi:hypothetical protein